MTLAKLPSGRWRARVWHDGKDRPVAPILGLPDGTTWATKKEARAAREKAREILHRPGAGEMTVEAWWERWTTDPRFERPKASTNIHNRERTRAFAERYASLPLRSLTRAVVDDWLAGGSRDGTIPALRAMFGDAVRMERMDRNPFAGLGKARTRGNRDQPPPSMEMVWDLIRAARKVSGPSFSAWLQVAAFTGIRPGELDALRWDAVDYDRSRILVAEQYSATSRTFTLPKNGRRRWAILTPQAREALVALPVESDFCFVNLRGEHWTASGRAYHWKATRAMAGYDGSLYLATRHFAGWFMVNVLGLSSEDVAIALGHTDGGQLVRLLYGHRDQEMALGRVLAAYEDQGNVRPLPRRDQEAG